ncbi:MAG: hypothetical protein M1491_01865 [Deltaproteobacteria bacterium]|nr:hypothetical protein [Deltaproteobacteria bacterium]MCL5277199.1 hypothetical protein [Deltaproteobacteria bacterium]
METEQRNYQPRRTQAELKKQAEETKKYFEDRQKLVDAGISPGLHQREMTEKAKQVIKDTDLLSELDEAMTKLINQTLNDAKGIAMGVVQTFGLDFNSGHGRGR